MQALETCYKILYRSSAEKLSHKKSPKHAPALKGLKIVLYFVFLSHVNFSSRISKTLETTERNIRQFFENNRINANDISEDTGLNKLDLQNFMDGICDLQNDEKMELYRWYLSKIQRLPTEEGIPSNT